MQLRRHPLAAIACAFALGSLLAAPLGCTTTSEEDSSTETGSEFVQDDQDEVEVPDTAVADTMAGRAEPKYWDSLKSTIQQEVAQLDGPPW